MTINIKKSKQETYLVCKIILGYSTFIDNFTNQFELQLTENGLAIKINKKKSTPLLKKAGRLMKMYLFAIRDFMRAHRLPRLK